MKDIGLAVIGCGTIGRIRAELARDYPGIKWLGLCDIRKDAAEKLVNEYNLSNKVVFFGKSNDIEKVLLKTDLFLLPSNSESFGLVALEAMAYSIPIITTNKGGITEVVDHEKNGFTIPVGNTNLMAQKAIDILSDSNIYRKFSQHAFNKSKQYDIEKILPLYPTPRLIQFLVYYSLLLQALE